MAASTLSTLNIAQTFAIATDPARGTASATAGTAFSSNGYFDMKDYDSILVQYTRGTGTGVLSAFSLNVSANADGSSGTSLKAHALGTAVDAVGDTVFLEAKADEIPAVLAGGRYVSASITHPTATEKAAIVVVRKAKTQKAGLTADVIA